MKKIILSAIAVLLLLVGANSQSQAQTVYYNPNPSFSFFVDPGFPPYGDYAWILAQDDSFEVADAINGESITIVYRIYHKDYPTVTSDNITLESPWGVFSTRDSANPAPGSLPNNGTLDLFNDGAYDVDNNLLRVEIISATGTVSGQPYTIVQR
ncbi:hypothetical protein VRU48_17770 [Pedobacter sp. KR3-3]|uniref:Gliding motility-associated C-terminal domain-containing protein n=1 Tax=Pedobacter albus TaxID=3113905 RepID=A0ABU7IBX9_9SPHI|nr:hypothetical protein [Pedobacter sp. KR3-3]MEE1946977.1 hypothetical protein [Pedobacter sp. KR3-3]